MTDCHSPYLKFMCMWEHLVGLVGRDLLHELVLHVEDDLPTLAEVADEVVEGVAVGYLGR